VLDPDTLAFVVADITTRVRAELIMRDDARRAGKPEMATLHGDRTQAFAEIVRVLNSWIR
jgi:hypothetical protein